MKLCKDKVLCVCSSWLSYRALQWDQTCFNRDDFQACFNGPFINVWGSCNWLLVSTYILPHVVCSKRSIEVRYLTVKWCVKHLITLVLRTSMWIRDRGERMFGGWSRCTVCSLSALHWLEQGRPEERAGPGWWGHHRPANPLQVRGEGGRGRVQSCGLLPWHGTFRHPSLWWLFPM